MVCEQSLLCPMYDQQIDLAERELSAFVRAVTELYGPEQAAVSAEDWLEESGLMDSPPRSEGCNWRSVTIAASTRLAGRVSVRTGEIKYLHSKKENSNVRLCK